MPLYADVRDLVEVLVLGVTNAEGMVNSRMLDACRDGYDRSLFLCPKLADVRGLASQIQQKVKNFQLVPDAEAPGATSILQAQAGQEALSLGTLMGIRAAMMAIRDNAEHHPPLRPLAGTIGRLFPDEQILPQNSIVPAFFAPSPAILRDFRERYCPAGTDRLAFSGQVMRDAFGDRLMERRFLEHLEDGFPSKHAEQGWYKLTEKSARLLHERMRTIAGEDFPEFEAFAPPAPNLGPRKGQISRALRVSFGNMV